MKRRQFLLAAAALGSSATMEAMAQDYPSRAVTLVVPFPAGSATDTVTRIIAQPLAAALGQPVVVENRPGAEGAIAAQTVIRSAPDGHTLLVATATAVTGVPALRKRPPYDPNTDFTPITQIANFPFILVVNSALGIRDLPALIAYAKANPGQLSYASGNMTGIVAMSQLISAAKIELLHVPYKGEPPAMLDVATGRVSLMFATPTTSDAFIRNGMVLPLVTTHKTRLPLFPDVPTFTEAGAADLSFAPWGGMFGPAGLPMPIAEKLSREVAAAMRQPATAAALQKQQVEVQTNTPQEFAIFIRKEFEEWRRLAVELNLQRD